MLQQLRIDPEFEGKIPPLREAELQQLEENILADGVVINPLIVWDGVIVDGHNRYRILQKHPEIQFATYEKQFPDRYAAIAWICKNQLGRRNLTPQQFKYLVGQRYEAEKQSKGIEFQGNQYTSQDRSGLGQNDPDQKSHGTRSRIAKETQTSDSYVRRAAHFSKGVDAAEEAVPGIKQEILSGSIKPTERAVAAIAKAPPEERTALVQQLRQAKETKDTATDEQGESKPKRSSAATLQAIRDISDHMLQSNGKMDADDICSELEDALDTMIFRWDTCLKANKTQRVVCQDGIQKLTDKGIQYLQKIRRKSI